MQAAFVLDQAAAWKARRPHDHVFILAPHDAAAARRERIGDIEIHRFQYLAPARLQGLAYPAILPNIRRNPLLLAQLPPFLWAQYRAARRLIRACDIDLVYAHWVMPQGLVARLLRARLGTPYVLQNHSSDVAVFDKLGRPGRAAARGIIANAQAMFCVNREQKLHVEALFAEPERREIAAKVAVLPMGVKAEDLPRSEARSPTTFAHTFGTISRLSRKKGIDLLIEAARRLADDVPGISVAIAGEGEDGDRLRALTANADISFRGVLTGEAKRAFFDETRFFVFPAVASGGDVEGLPVALLEALCAGKLIVASRDTNVAMLPEWEQIAPCIAYVEDPRDIGKLAAAMRGLLDLRQAEADARSQHLRAVMSRYLWERLIGEYLEIIGSAPEPAAQV